jgi:hypothetical protein
MVAILIFYLSSSLIVIAMCEFSRNKWKVLHDEHSNKQGSVLHIQVIMTLDLLTDVMCYQGYRLNQIKFQ